MEKFDFQKFKQFIPKNPDAKKMLRKGALYLCGILAITGILVVIDLHSNQRIYARVSVGPVALGYTLRDEAAQQLQKRTDAYLQTPITFVVQPDMLRSQAAASGQTQQPTPPEIQVTPQELGIAFENDKTLKTLPVFEFPKMAIRQLVSSIFSQQKYPLSFEIDGDQVVRTLEKKFNITDLRARNAKLMADKKNLTIQPETDGIVIDRPQVLRLLENDIRNLQTEPIQIALIPEKAGVTQAALSEQKQRFETALKTPLHFYFEGRKWKMDPSLHLDAITFEDQKYITFKNLGWKLPIVLKDGENLVGQNNNFTIEAQPQITFVRPQIDDFLDKNVISQINKPASELKIYKDEQGQIVLDGKGEDGLDVSKPMLLVGLAKALNQGVSAIEIPAFQEKAKVEIAQDLQDLGIKKLIATGRTTFYGSPANRVYNINVGIKKYNGIVVQPGEEFSFNKILGPVDGSTGFLPEKIIKENKIEMEFGGGVCQVSTTAYRAALLAGLQIKERAPHSIKVAYYAQVLGHGLDATIYPGSRDFRFVNNTPGALLMQAYTDGSSAYFKFYGTDDGRQVALDGPHGGGLSYTWYRTIIKDGQKKTETISSQYHVITPPTPPTPPAAPALTAQQPAATASPKKDTGTAAKISKPVAENVKTKPKT